MRPGSCTTSSAALTPKPTASFSKTSKSMPEVLPVSMLLIAGRGAGKVPLGVPDPRQSLRSRMNEPPQPIGLTRVQ